MTPFDALRAQHPDKGFAVYAYEPGGPVILEVHAGGAILTTEAASLEEAIARAFPGFETPAAAIARVLAPIVNGEPLGGEFQRIWDENLDEILKDANPPSDPLGDLFD